VGELKINAVPESLNQFKAGRRRPNGYAYVRTPPQQHLHNRRRLTDVTEPVRG
jgi:hypothetical protein